VIAVVQDVVVRWTRASRGGHGARERSALPRVFELPRLPEATASLATLLHTVTMDEADDFRPAHQLEVVPWTSGRVHRLPGLSIRIARDGITVDFAWEWSVGAPERDAPPRRVVTIGPAEWGRAAYNGRYTTLAGMDDWKYRERTLSVAMLEAPTTRPFVGEPRKTFESLADLR